MNFFELPHPWRSLATWIGSTWVASALFWLCFGTFVLGACVDAPFPDVEPQARVVASWDPLDCGDPHRVVIELEDHAGVPISKSVPCSTGGVTIDMPHWGVYLGQVYAWSLGPEIRSVTSVRLDIDQPVVFWTVDTPR